MKNWKKICALFLLAVLYIALLTTSLYSAISIPPRSRAEIEAVLAYTPEMAPESKLRQLNIVLVAGAKDHDLHEHDYPLWQKRWQLLIAGKGASNSSENHVNLYGPPIPDPKALEGAPGVNVSTAIDWPSEKQFETADVIVSFCHGGKSSSQWNQTKIQQLDQYLARGGGFVALHSTCVTHKALSQDLAGQLGFVWEYDYTKFRHGPMDLQIMKPYSSVCMGLPKKIEFFDEAYWRLCRNFKTDPAILGSSKETIDHDPTQTQLEPIFWTYTPEHGRVFVCTLGHYTWTFDDPYFRIIVLRGMAWAAGESCYRFDPLVTRGIKFKEDLPKKHTAAIKADPKTVEEAIANYTAMLSLPDTPEQQKSQIHADLGRIFFKYKNDTQSLLTETNKALAFDRENHFLLYNMGIAKLFLSKPEQAINLCLPAIQKFSIDQIDENLQLLTSKSWNLPKTSTLAYDKIIHSLNLRKKELQ